MSTWFLVFWTCVLLQSRSNWIEAVAYGKELKETWTDVSTHPSKSMAHELERNTHLRIYASNVPPVMTIIGNPKFQPVKLEGLAIDFVEYMVQHLNLTIEYIFENQTEVQKLGQVEVIMKSLINKEVDLVLIGMIVTPERAKILDMTLPIMYSDYRIMVRWPEEMDRWTEVARPYDKYTWSMIALTIIVMIAMVTLLTLVIYGRFNRDLIIQTVGEKIMYVIGIMSNQGNSETTRRLSLRILLGCWLLMAVVLINAYTGTLTSNLTVPKLKPIPQSLEDLVVMSQDYHITTRASYLLAESFLNASSGTYRILGEFLREHPNFLFKEFPEATDIVLKQKGACVEPSAVISVRIVRDYKLHGKCRMTASNPISPAVQSMVQSFSAALPKDSSFTRTFDAEQQRARETGLVDYWRKKYVPNMDRCKLENQKKGRKPTPISLAHLSSAFVVLGIGVAFSLFAFVVEIIISFRMKLKARK